MKPSFIKRVMILMANELDFNDMEFKTYMNFALNKRFGFSFQAEFKILA